MSQDNVETVRATIEANSLLSVFDENAELHAPDWGLDTGVFRGSEAIRERLSSWNVFTLTGGKVVGWRFYRTREEALEAAGL